MRASTSATLIVSIRSGFDCLLVTACSMTDSMPWVRGSKLDNKSSNQFSRDKRLFKQSPMTDVKARRLPDSAMAR